MRSLKKRIWDIVLIALVAILLFVPPAKALVIRGLMEIGLYNPGVEPSKMPAATPTVDLSGIRFKDNTGKVIDLGELKGKVIFVNFWASWCPPCQAEMPSVNRLYQQFKNNKNMVFLMVDGDSDLQKAAAYMRRKGFELPVHQVAGPIPEQLFAGSLPTTLVFDKYGRISFQKVGAADYNDKRFVAFMNQLVSMKY